MKRREGRGEVGIGLTKDANCQKKAKKNWIPRIFPEFEREFWRYITLHSGNRGVEFLEFRALSLICPTRHFLKKPRIKPGGKQIDLMGNKATCDTWPKIKQEGTVCVAIVFFCPAIPCLGTVKKINLRGNASGIAFTKIFQTHPKFPTL